MTATTALAARIQPRLTDNALEVLRAWYPRVEVTTLVIPGVNDSNEESVVRAARSREVGGKSRD